MSNEYKLSANTLFHFTKTYDNLENILENEFIPRYCLENYSDLITGSLNETAIPMVSFCDIPLSQINNHVKHYGSYAIGLTKDWGIKNRICPVIYYTAQQCGLMFPVKEIYDIAYKGLESPENKSLKEIYLNLHKFIKYLKPYRGKLWRDNKYLDETITFYDEREWRFCPDIPIPDEPTDNYPKHFMYKEIFMSTELKNNENLKLTKYKISFEPKDIKYIIVNKEDEILDMVNKVILLKAKYPYEDVQVLTTKIISITRIFEDF